MGLFKKQEQDNQWYEKRIEDSHTLILVKMNLYMFITLTFPPNGFIADMPVK